MTEIKKLNRKALYEYITSQEFESADQIAISHHRAISHIANPRAKDEDILLFLAYEGEELCGYLGALPDDWQDATGLTVHCAWMSCLWVDPNHRGKKIAQKLINACFEAWNDQVILTEFTDEAGSLYRKMGIFEDWVNMKGRRWYIGADLHHILPPKSGFFQKIKPILKLTDKVANVMLSVTRRLIPVSSVTPGFREVEVLSDEAAQWLDDRTTVSGFNRKSAEINWIVRYPWIQQGEPTHDSNRYYFTSVASEFKNVLVETRDETGLLTGVMLMSSRNGHLRIPYLLFNGDWYQLVRFIRSFIRRNRIKIITIYHPDLHKFLKEHRLVLVPSKEISRTYLRSVKMDVLQSSDRDYIQDGDGDSAFT